ncbi:hypothetical protein YC2023_011640 [Brassica napus]
MAKRLFAVLECQSLLENLSPFVDPKRPKNFPDGESPTCPSPNSVIGFPELTEEPKSDSDRSVLCRLCVRLPDGRKVQRNFLRSESVQLLWSFCYSLMDESERRERSFKLIQAVPGEYKSLYYGSETSFEDSGLANSLISVIWVVKYPIKSSSHNIVSCQSLMRETSLAVILLFIAVSNHIMPSLA